MPQPPQKGHPLALALYKLLRDRPEADRRFVYRALVANSVYSAGEERSAVAMHGLETCAAETGGTPSRRTYDAWRASKPDPGEWASSSQIRGAFGSWPKALDALGLEPAEDTLARRLLSRAGRFTEDDCTAAIERCVDEVTDSGESPIRRLTFREYKSWAHRRNAAAADHGTEQQLPTPVNVKTFHQLFGTWGEALAAAGHAELATPTAGVRYPGPGGPHDSYSESDILAALKQAGADQGPERKLTMNAYRDRRARKLDEAVTDGRVEHIPGLRVVAAFYGSWAEALAAA